MTTCNTPETLLAEPDLWTTWALPRSVAGALIERLRRLRPASVLELGSGTSTALLRMLVREWGGHVLSLEHEAPHAALTSSLCTLYGVSDPALGEVALAPIEDIELPGDMLAVPWYGVSKIESFRSRCFDFVLVDGPPANIGRAGAIFGLKDKLSYAAEIWIDDGRRAHEQAVARAWAAELGCEEWSYVPGIGRGLHVLHNRKQQTL